MIPVVIDAGAPMHRKLRNAGPNACWLWVHLLAWCRQYPKLNGSVPKRDLEHIAPGVWSSTRRAKLLSTLVDEGLLHVEGDAYAIHDYDQQTDLLARIARQWLTQNGLEAVPATRGSVAAVRSVAGKAGATARWRASVADGNGDSKTSVAIDGNGFSVSTPTPTAAASNSESMNPDIGKDYKKSAVAAASARDPDGKPDGKPDGNNDATGCNVAATDAERGAFRTETLLDCNGRPTALWAYRKWMRICCNTHHTLKQWRSEFETIAMACWSEGDFEAAGDALLEYFWRSPQGPVKSGRIRFANPGHLAKYIDRDIAIAMGRASASVKPSSTATATASQASPREHFDESQNPEWAR